MYHTCKRLENAVLAEIGSKYGKTTAQVMLCWNIQRGVVVLPKSTHKESMIQNFDVFDFVLSDEDCRRLTPETIRCSVKTSLKRLQTDHIDLYYQHRIDPKIPSEEVAGVMSELNGTLNYFSAVHEESPVTVNGDNAEIIGHSKVNAAVFGGGRHTWRLEQVIIMQKIGGEWKITHSTAGTY